MVFPYFSQKFHIIINIVNTNKKGIAAMTVLMNHYTAIPLLFKQEQIIITAF